MVAGSHSTTLPKSAARAVAAIGSPSIVQVFDAGLTPDGKASIFAVMPDGGRANGIRVDSKGFLIVADYVRHIVYRVDPASGKFLESLTADWKGPQFYQPNDVGIASDDTIYFSDPDGHRLQLLTSAEQG